MKEVEYKVDRGQKFALSIDKIEIVIHALVVYQQIVLPISHSLDFFYRMNDEFDISAISCGSYLFNEETTKKMSELVTDFEKMAYSFFVSNGIELWKPILSAESVGDLLDKLRVV